MLEPYSDGSHRVDDIRRVGTIDGPDYFIGHLWRLSEPDEHGRQAWISDGTIRRSVDQSWAEAIEELEQERMERDAAKDFSHHPPQ